MFVELWWYKLYKLEISLIDCLRKKYRYTNDFRSFKVMICPIAAEKAIIKTIKYIRFVTGLQSVLYIDELTPSPTKIIKA